MCMRVCVCVCVCVCDPSDTAAQRGELWRATEQGSVQATALQRRGALRVHAAMALKSVGYLVLKVFARSCS